MAGAVAVVVPSRVEAFGIVALEAWRSGAPLVMTDRGGAPGFVHDGVDGILVDPVDTAALRAALARVAADAACGRSWPRVASAYPTSPGRRVADAYDAVYRRGVARRGIARERGDLFEPPRDEPASCDGSRWPPPARRCGAAASWSAHLVGRPPELRRRPHAVAPPRVRRAAACTASPAHDWPGSAASSSSCRGLRRRRLGQRADARRAAPPAARARARRARAPDARTGRRARRVALGDPGILVGRRRSGPNSSGTSHSCRTDITGSTSRSWRSRTEGYRVRVVNVHQTAARVVREIAAAGRSSRRPCTGW